MGLENKVNKSKENVPLSIRIPLGLSFLGIATYAFIDQLKTSYQLWQQGDQTGLAGLIGAAGAIATTAGLCAYAYFKNKSSDKT